MPWSYELYFLSLLFHTGIVGIAAYALGIVWIVFHGIRIIRGDPALRLYMIPVLVAMICFLIASNTNPYLAKFDYLWVIFLPVAIINHHLLKGNAPRPRVPGNKIIMPVDIVVN
jgi:O-antigen ligase